MTGKPVTSLTNMQITEVAVCRTGMNPGATVALFKSADSAPSPSPSSSEAPSMSTTSGAAPPGSVAKTVPLTISPAAPTSDPFAKSVKEIMDDLFKGVANPPVALYAGITKAIADAKVIGFDEVKKVQDAIATGTSALAKAMDDDAKTFGQVLPAELAMQDWWRFNDALYSALRSILESTETDDTKLQLVMISLEEFKNVLTRRMAAAIAAAAAATDALLKSCQTSSNAVTPASTIQKGEPAVSGNNAPITDTLAKAATVEDVIKALPEGAAALVTAAIAKGAAPVEDPIAKALETNPILKAQFATMQKAVDEANAIAKAEKEAREHGVRITKAGTDFGNLPTTAENMAGVLKAMESMDEPVRKTLTEVLKAGNEAIGKNVLGGEIGSGAVSKAGASTTMGTINAKAADLMKADATLTKSDAIEKVLDADVQLQKAYLEEMK